MPITHSPNNASGGVETDKMNNGTCSICNESVHSDGDKVETACKHKFHLSCIRTWLDKNPTCPICRQACSLTDLKPNTEGVERTTGAIPRDRRNTRRYAQGNPQLRNTSGNPQTTERAQSPSNQHRAPATQASHPSTISERKVQEIVAQALVDFRNEMTSTLLSE
ncbi:PREDICTED: uncharacterized RING finger protein P32A8.03c-like, partial [Rhagoletis zephyria]|uniref:uncharacterized RING finger protein P32A8.03c-like n=1 Tax=Rhagoletis zephyria TaxID=28612 RepID=UPI0008114BB7